MLATSGIWLIGYQFTWSVFGMQSSSCSGHDGFGGGVGRENAGALRPSA